MLNPCGCSYALCDEVTCIGGAYGSYFSKDPYEDQVFGYEVLAYEECLLCLLVNCWGVYGTYKHDACFISLSDTLFIDNENNERIRIKDKKRLMHRSKIHNKIPISSINLVDGVGVLPLLSLEWSC